MSLSTLEPRACYLDRKNYAQQDANDLAAAISWSFLKAYSRSWSLSASRTKALSENCHSAVGLHNLFELLLHLPEMSPRQHYWRS